MAYVQGMATFPENLRYTDTHEWVRDREKLVTIGLTQTAADQLGPVGFVELPYPGDILKADLVMCRVRGDAESKAIKLPFVVKVMTVNPLLEDQPGLINSDPYGAGWMVQVRVKEESELDALLGAKEYENHVG